MIFSSLVGGLFSLVATLKGKNLLSLESKFFPSRVTTNNMGGKHFLVRVNSLRGISKLQISVIQLYTRNGSLTNLQLVKTQVSLHYLYIYAA